MAGRSGSGGVAAVGVVAGILGVVHATTGGLAVIAGAGSLGEIILALSRAVLGVMLLPTALALIRGSTWSRWAGVVGFGGLAVVQLLPMLAGETMALPLAGILLASLCALYLLLAGEEFDSGGERAISEDTNPHDFMQ